MGINFKGQTPVYIAVDALPRGKNKDKEASKTIYINPQTVSSIEPSSKKERLEQGYDLRNSGDPTESKITLTNGQQFHINLTARDAAERLSDGSRIKNLILDYEA